MSRYPITTGGSGAEKPKAMHPMDALRALADIMEEKNDVAMVGITGPGDPLATPEETIDTLKNVRANYPDLPLCLTMNGLHGAPYAEALAEMNISHVTIQVNAVEPGIAAQLYSWIRPGTKTLPIAEAAKVLVLEQEETIKALKKHGVVVKINTTVYPGFNELHVGDVAQKMAELGADIMHVVPYLPPEGECKGESNGLMQPSADVMQVAKEAAATHITLMEAPDSCGSPASGLEDLLPVEDQLAPAAALPKPDEDKPYVAVATSDGFDVNQHLGRADKLLIYGPKDGPPKMLEVRQAPAPGGGAARWEALADVISDCKILLVESAGQTPEDVLTAKGIRVLRVNGNIEGIVDVIYGGGKKGKCKKK